MEGPFEASCNFEEHHGAINGDRSYAPPRIPQLILKFLSGWYAMFRKIFSFLLLSLF